MTAVKVSVLLVDKTFAQAGTAHYSFVAETAQYAIDNFTRNLGVPTAFFGQPSSSRSCIHGLIQLDIFLYRTSYENQPAYFIFEYQGSEIVNISFSGTGTMQLQSVCLGLCPSSMYFEN
jgi:hypothetical protein